MPITKGPNLEDQIKDLIQKHAPNMTSFSAYKTIDDQAILNDTDSILIQHIDELNTVPLSQFFESIQTDIGQNISDTSDELLHVIYSSNIDNSNYTDIKITNLSSLILPEGLSIDNNPEYRLDIGYKGLTDDYADYFDAYVMPTYQPLEYIQSPDQLNDLIVYEGTRINLLAQIVERTEYTRSIKGIIYYPIPDQLIDTAFAFTMIIDDTNTDMRKEILQILNYKLIYEKNSSIRKLITSIPIKKITPATTTLNINLISSFTQSNSDYTVSGGEQFLFSSDPPYIRMHRSSPLTYNFTQPKPIKQISWQLQYTDPMANMIGVSSSNPYGLIGGGGDSAVTRRINVSMKIYHEGTLVPSPIEYLSYYDFTTYDETTTISRPIDLAYAPTTTKVEISYTVQTAWELRANHLSKCYQYKCCMMRLYQKQ